MKTLSIECSAAPVSAAISENGKIIKNDFSNIKVTHSQTLMPMIKSVIADANLSIKDIDAFAVAAGPGSFTGVRIGISAVKGLATPENKPCYAVSTLEAMAYMFLGENAVICPVMDARCNQLYNALFRVDGQTVTRITDDRAIMCEQLAGELLNFNEKIIITGDGHKVFSTYINNNSNVVLADDKRLYQNAVGVALCAENAQLSPTEPENLLPVYLRLPQAERELKEKRKQK